MSSIQEYTRKRMKYSVRISNVTVFYHGNPDEFRLSDNLLWNSFGPPMWVLTKSILPGPSARWYHKKNIDGLWQRFRNEYFFVNKADRELFIRFLPQHYEQTKQII